MTTSGVQRTSFLVEWVLSVNGPMPEAEKALRVLRKALEEAAPGLPCTSLGTFASQEFGQLACTVRVGVDADSLVAAAEQAVRCAQPSLMAAQEATGVLITAAALHSRLL
ncbi:MAG: hypothetical protein JWO12_2722 [Frankiales bacterium]|nr:hypothetical protein [Frankiales bacterium]